MAEFVEVIKQKERMCDSFSECIKCPLAKNNIRDCVAFEFHNAEEAEKIIMEWAKEHPVITNREKFNEVFGVEFGADLSKTKCSFICGGRDSCTGCKYDYFWDREYEEPKGDN